MSFEPSTSHTFKDVSPIVCKERGWINHGHILVNDTRDVSNCVKWLCGSTFDFGVQWEEEQGGVDPSDPSLYTHNDREYFSRLAAHDPQWRGEVIMTGYALPLITPADVIKTELGLRICGYVYHFIYSSYIREYDLILSALCSLLCALLSLWISDVMPKFKYSIFNGKNDLFVADKSETVLMGSELKCKAQEANIDMLVMPTGSYCDA